MSKKRFSVFTPIIAAICIIIGIFVGMYYSSPHSNNIFVTQSPTNKLNSVLRIIDENYVDTVDMQEIVEDALPHIISELDPHSIYVPKVYAQEVSSELEGSFSGVGIQFTIQQDTIYVNSVVKQGPAEEVGIIAGDRIVTVDDSLFVGKKVTNSAAMRTLKGPKGTQVKLGIRRSGEPELLNFMVTRGDIPQNTIDATYMLNDKFGYIQLSKFGRTTYVELINSMALLLYQNCEGVIIDLRGNKGGYLDIVVKIVNEFLPKQKLIVFTEGRKMLRQDIYSNGSGGFQNIPLVLLIDEGSASSSEIFAAAIQDNDRGTIIGRRSYGKGLVQQEMTFNDSSLLRLTIARYFTPSGRSIQKPYTKGDSRDYDMDIIHRIEHGELYSKDSIKLDPNLLYHTNNGRPVYGGGGIMPDIFVPQDTIAANTYLTDVLRRGLIIQFSFQYTDKNRDRLAKFETEKDLENFLKKQYIVDRFVQFAETKGVRRRNLLINKAHSLLEKSLNANIIYNILGMEAHIKYLNKTDTTILKAIDVLDKGESLPQPINESLSDEKSKESSTE
ncbi:carboxyl-terminal protease [Bacteroides coprosuis DSM 18011]|uniref:Carboxyl-terminal protease n=1 Tax=Bacteroides coprosuis DSM 18011 TaxID=679937 RepID=F3ZU46_9BACE|nr:S41 family peptidase [Bacteroides coprosuis]EGJ71147.1 carboxyl-terminal protease [Bacteroides coprosuis DSM 18011]